MWLVWGTEAWDGCGWAVAESERVNNDEVERRGHSSMSGLGG